jgi:hypothetical protein
LADAGEILVSLFQLEKFISHSGILLDWKVECDNLSVDDWRCLAMLAKQKLPPFRNVVGVPSGGMIFAEQLLPYANPKAPLIVIADDVYTTGLSMLEMAKERLDVVGCVAFARAPVPSWIVPVWRLY